MRNDVRALRLAKGLSQGELGAILDVSRQTVNAIETGRYNPSLLLGVRLARFFGRTVEEVFHVDDE
jgi:putative transcriptional regulator